MAEKHIPAVIVRNLTKSFRIPLDKNPNLKHRILHGLKGGGYREFTPLKDVSFQVNKGEFFGIVGRNGSGKSTMLKSIAGIYTPDGGQVIVNGSLVPFIELGVGFNPDLSGRENIYLNGALLGFSRSEIGLMYDDIVDFAELHDFMEERLRNYSSGMQVRLAFSIAIRAKGDVLLLDEVLAVGDSAFQQKCLSYFEMLKREKHTVILVSHSMSSIQRYCDRALLLEKGKIVDIGDSTRIANLYEELFVKDANKAAKDKAEEVSIDSANSSACKIKASIKQANKAVETIKAYQPFNIVVEIESNKIIIGSSLEIKIRDEQNRIVYYFDTKKDTGGISFKKGETKVIKYLVENYYANGNYLLDAHFIEEGVLEGGVELLKKSLAKFSVMGAIDHADSLFQPPTKLEISTKSSTKNKSSSK